jgi:hypothetical protein
MGQFKPMVKMETTEPSVELKLKGGGAVKKMQMGGTPAAAPSMPARGGAMPAMAPKKPSMAARRRAMMARPSGAAPAGPVGMAGRMMKEGGEADLKKHAAMPASKAHAGLKTGGVAMGQGGYKKGGSVHTTKVDTAKPDHSPAKTGDVKMGNAGGFKKGGVAKYAKGGGVTGNVSTSHAGVTGTTTGEVKKANAGGYKEGGAAKKAFATGGLVNTGRPVAMPQGQKRPPSPVSINRLSGTYKKGGEVKMNGGGAASKEKIPSEAALELQVQRNQKAYEDYEKSRAEEAKAERDMIPNLAKRAVSSVKRLFSPSPAASAPGSVTKTEKSVTVTPGKKSGGRC